MMSVSPQLPRSMCQDGAFVQELACSSHHLVVDVEQPGQLDEDVVEALGLVEHHGGSPS